MFAKASPHSPGPADNSYRSCLPDESGKELVGGGVPVCQRVLAGLWPWEIVGF